MHVAAPEKASTCRSKCTKREWIENVSEYVIACNSLKGKNSQMEVVEEFESRPDNAVSFLVEKERRRCRNGTSRSCQRCCRVSVGEGYHVDTYKKKAEKKERWKRAAEKG